MDLMLKQHVNYFIMSAASRNTERVDAEQVTYWRICATLDKAESEFFEIIGVFPQKSSKIRSLAFQAKFLQHHSGPLVLLASLASSWKVVVIRMNFY